MVNATSATVGGSLTILNQFIENICDDSDKDKIYYVFVPITSDLKSCDNIIIVPIRAKKYVDRIKWDLIGMRKWFQKSGIKPDLIISLQNTAVLFGKVKQIIYLHQPLIYAKESSWSILKKDERKMWFYRYIYKVWVKSSIKKDHYIVVQTEWMKESVIKSGYSKDKIIISKPKMNYVDIDEVKPLDNENKKYLFYPAADYKYKNHMILIKAIRNIVENNDFIKEKYKIVFTLEKDSIVYKHVIEYGLEDYFEFVGVLPYQKVLSYYKGCQAVLFPSYIETFGLPLIEASVFGKKILVSDCEYSREVLNGYDMAEFIKYDDSMSWSKAIIENLKPYCEETKIDFNENGYEKVFKLIDSIIYEY